VKYIFIGKQKVVLYFKLRKNQRKAAASALRSKRYLHIQKVQFFILTINF
jgi:hypothetical protein